MENVDEEAIRKVVNILLGKCFWVPIYKSGCKWNHSAYAVEQYWEYVEKNLPVIDYERLVEYKPTIESPVPLSPVVTKYARDKFPIPLFTPAVTRFLKEMQRDVVIRCRNILEAKDACSNFDWENSGNIGRRIFGTVANLIRNILDAPMMIIKGKVIILMDLDALKPGSSIIRKLEVYFPEIWEDVDGKAKLKPVIINGEYAPDNIYEIVYEAFHTFEEFLDQCAKHHPKCVFKVEEVKIKFEKIKNVYYPFGIEFSTIEPLEHQIYKDLEELRILFADYKPKPVKAKIPQDDTAQKLLEYAYQQNKTKGHLKKKPRELIKWICEESMRWKLAARIILDDAEACNDGHKVDEMKDNLPKYITADFYKRGMPGGKWTQYYSTYKKTKTQKK